MPKSTSSGKCRLCGELFAKAQMTRHLKSCLSRTEAEGKSGKAGAPCFHLLVEATYIPIMWLHLEVPGSTLFGQLDRVLRDIWLECCGHMSAFRFPEKAASSQRLMMDVEKQMREERKLMSVEVGKRLEPKMKLSYEYDFGSTTDLTIRVVEERPNTLDSPARIRLLARNEPPDLLCVDCGKPAKLICVECAWESDGTYCTRCGKKHECGEDMLVPVVNSPRMGVCGYTGPSVEP